MDFIKKNALIVGLVVVVILGVGGFFVWNGLQNKAVSPKSGEEQINAKPMKPEDIGLEVSLRPDNKAVSIKATKVAGVKSFEYELTYDAEVTEDGDTATVPRGAVGELTIRGGAATAEVDLGTCSANVCKYDKVVSDVKIVIKVNFENGEVGAVEDVVSLKK